MGTCPDIIAMVGHGPISLQLVVGVMALYQFCVKCEVTALYDCSVECGSCPCITVLWVKALYDCSVMYGSWSCITVV